jgi:hypothetical protein
VCRFPCVWQACVSSAARNVTAGSSVRITQVLGFQTGLCTMGGKATCASAPKHIKARVKIIRTLQHSGFYVSCAENPGLEFLSGDQPRYDALICVTYVRGLFRTLWNGHLLMEPTGSKLCYSRRSVSLDVKPHLRPNTIFLLLSGSCGFINVGYPL